MVKSKRTTFAAKCLSCNSTLNHDAKFCHKCGAPADSNARARSPVWKYVASVVVLVAVGAGLLLALFGSNSEFDSSTSSTPLDTPNFIQVPKPPPDLSTMTPREAADRLFNRVMAANESGSNAEALHFAPMALLAYQRADALDNDALYHVGLINLVLEDLDAVGKQIGLLKRGTPNHLLGLSLAYEVEMRAGNEASISEVLAKFSDAYDVEVGRGKLEYEAHKVTINKLHVLTTNFKSPAKPNLLPVPVKSGEQLFVDNCVQCHGPNASGTNNGPPLVHRYYKPGHHADAAFYRAVAQGVKSHHWNFGNMPPVPDITEEEVAKIISYVRDVQEENGIK